MPAFTALPAWTHSTGFCRELQVKPRCHCTAARDYSVSAQANAQSGAWTPEAPEALNRSRKLEFLYFLPFVARTAGILKSRSSRFPCCTATQSLTIKCPSTCHHSDTSPVCAWDLPLPLLGFSYRYRSCAFSVISIHIFHLSQLLLKGIDVPFVQIQALIIMVTITRRSFLFVCFQIQV